MSETKTDLRELYKNEFGKYPSKNMKEETIAEKLKEAGIEIHSEEPKEEPVLKSEEPKIVAQGQGLATRHLVYFRGQERWWTAASIKAMSAFADEIEFPENTKYEGSATMSKCKNC